MKRKERTNSGRGTSTINQNAPEIGNDAVICSTSSCLLICLFVNLPFALLCDILFKLPIKSLMNVKVVCKALYNLISTRDFLNNYSKNSPFATFLVPHSDPTRPVFHMLEKSDSSCDYIHTTFKPNIPDWSDNNSYVLNIAGTCNGVVCLVVSRLRSQKVYICNPVKGGECELVAKYTLEHFQHASFGFGICRSTGNYKILKIVSNRKGEILTIGVDDTWRGLDPVANPINLSPFDYLDLVVVNKSIYWIVRFDRNIWIDSFDFEEEKMFRIFFPPRLWLVGHLHVGMSSIDDQLCIIGLNNYSKIVIWKLKVCRGVVDSWSKDVLCDAPPEVPVRWHHETFMRILKNGDILFNAGFLRSSLVYNPTKRKFTDLKFRCLQCIGYSPRFSSMKEIMTGESVQVP